MRGCLARFRPPRFHVSCPGASQRYQRPAMPAGVPDARIAVIRDGYGLAMINATQDIPRAAKTDGSTVAQVSTAYISL